MTLKKVRNIKYILSHGKFAITLDCGHRFVFDHTVTKLKQMPTSLPCKICFCSHR